MKAGLRIFFTIFILLWSVEFFSQANNSNCANATPFCTGQTMNFPATVNGPPSQVGPFYDCLFSQPNPAWFFFQINSGGPMSISMSAIQDIDFCCWGPFPSLNGACNNLTQGNVQDCSYSSSATETCVIANAIPGMFYIMVITNFANVTQNITFNQSNANQPGAASTNCGIVCVVSPTNSGIICQNGVATISLTPATSSAVSSYTWFGPNSWQSNNALNVVGGLTASAVYTVIGTASSMINNTVYTSTCQATTTVPVIPFPGFTITPTFTSICQGGSFNASVSFTDPPYPAGNTFTWYPTTGAGVANPNFPGTLISPNLLPTTVTLSTVVYSVTVVPIASPLCPVTKTLAVTINNPLTPSLSMPSPQCDTYQPLQLFATPGGGTWSANPAVNAAGIFSPAIAAIGINQVNYAVSVGTCVVANNGTLQVNKFHTAALAQTLGNRCVQDAPYRLNKLPLDTATGQWSGQNVSAGYFNFAGLATGNYTVYYNTVSFPNPTVCPDVSTMVFPVFNPPTPTITPVAPVCNINAQVQLNASPPNGVWSSSGGVTPGGLQTPSLCLMGANSVTYSAGQGTCIASQSANFHVSWFRTAALTGTISPLCAKGGPVGLMSITQNTNGSWSGTNVTGNSFNPAGLPTNTYQLTYFNTSTPNPTLCPDSKSTLVHVLNPPTPTILPAGPFCSADLAKQLMVSPATGSWVPALYLKTSGVFTPSLSNIGNNTVQYVIGTNTCFASHSVQIVTEAFVPATVTQTLPDLCTNGQTVNLTPYSAVLSGTWSGSGISNNIFDPASAGAGTFKLMHQTASSPGGLCPDSDTLSARVFSIAVPQISGAGPVCNNALPFQLKVTPLGGFFGDVSNGPVTAGGIFHPAFATIGENLVGYTVSAGPCLAYDRIKISVERFVSAELSKQPGLAYCKTAEPFSLAGFAKNQGGSWAGPGVINGSMFYPEKANVGENTIVYRTNSLPTVLLCPDASTLNLKVKEKVNVVAFSNKVSGCAPLTITFSSDKNQEGKGFWHFGDATEQQSGFQVIHTYTAAGIYPVLFRYSDSEAIGCDAEYRLPMSATVLASPVAAFEVEPSEVTISNPDVTLRNQSIQLISNQYVWTIGGIGEVYDMHPQVTFPQVGNYRVTLQATAPNGCKSEVTREVEVKNDFSVYIPNTFTPDMDGINDVFMPVFSPYGLDLESYEFTIYDRWGHLVFFTRDYRKGWDGTYQNKTGDALKEDSFNYVIRFRDLDGRSYQRAGLVIRL